VRVHVRVCVGVCRGGCVLVWLCVCVRVYDCQIVSVLCVRVSAS